RLVTIVFTENPPMWRWVEAGGIAGAPVTARKVVGSGLSALSLRCRRVALGASQDRLEELLNPMALRFSRFLKDSPHVSADRREVRHVRKEVVRIPTVIGIRGSDTRAQQTEGEFRVRTRQFVILVREPVLRTPTRETPLLTGSYIGLDLFSHSSVSLSACGPV